MLIVKWVVTIIIILLILGFAVQNTTEEVSLVFVKGAYETGPLPIWLVVYISFAMGVIFWFFFSVFEVMSLKVQIRKMRGENERVRRELNHLRNLSVETEVELQPKEDPKTQLLPEPEPEQKQEGSV